MSKHLAEIESFITLFQERRAKRVEQFLNDFERQRRERPTAAAFNVFSLLRVGADEVRHSAFLAWLLDANEAHGLRDRFLRALLDAAEPPISIGTIGAYRVLTEYHRAEAIIDILVYRVGAFVLYIENKIGAEEGTDQLAREYRDMQRTGAALQIPPERRFAIFLTPEGRRPATGDPKEWHTLSYLTLAAGFRDVLPQVTSERVHGLVEDWVETVGRFAEGA